MEEKQQSPTSSDTKQWNTNYRIDKDKVIKFLTSGNAIAILHTEAPLKAKFDHIRIKVIPDKEKEYKWLVYLQTSRGVNATHICYLYKHEKGYYFCNMRDERYAKEVQIVKFFIFHLQHKTLPSFMNVYHVGRCGKCGRPLTDPGSINIGLGPVCRGEQ